MFERFTDRAKKVMSFAHQEAMKLHHEYIGTEHILLGLVQEGSGVAASVLKNRNIDLEKIRREVEKIVKAGPSTVTMRQLPYTPRARKVLELSMEEASQLSHDYICTEHLLLGLIREQEGIAAQVLAHLGIDVDAVRAEVLDFHDVRPAAARAADAPAGVVDDDMAASKAVFALEGAAVAHFVPIWRPAVERGLAGVLLPRGRATDALFANAIDPGLRAGGIARVHRAAADPPAYPGVFFELLRAEVLVAVTTGSDPDVLYLLGLCHGLGRFPLLLHARGDESPPTTGTHVLGYADDDAGRERLVQDLAARIRERLAELARLRTRR